MTYKTPAIVLRSFPWPRWARFYVLYTRDYGKVRAVASGSQKIVSKVAGHLQPFVLTEAMFARGRRVDRLAQARLEKRYAAFSQDFSVYLLGAYLLEVIESLTQEGVADQAVWESILEVFEEVDQQGKWLMDEQSTPDQYRLRHLSRMFSLRLLDRFGYRPELYRCIHCRKPLQEGVIGFSLLHGGVIDEACASGYPDRLTLSAETVKILRCGLTYPLLDAQRVIASQECLDQMSSVVDQLIMMQTQRPLRSLSVF